VDPAPPLAACVGIWRQYGDKIVPSRVGNQPNADREAYWPGKVLMPANGGEFGGTATFGVGSAFASIQGAAPRAVTVDCVA
jgi:hypothetical protein